MFDLKRDRPGKLWAPVPFHQPESQIVARGDPARSDHVTIVDDPGVHQQRPRPNEVVTRAVMGRGRTASGSPAAGKIIAPVQMDATVAPASCMAAIMDGVPRFTSVRAPGEPGPPFHPPPGTTRISASR